MNLVLMFFNLIPLPPLDGSQGAAALPLRSRDGHVSQCRALRLPHHPRRALAAALLLGVDPLGWYFGATVYPLLGLFTGV
jgi:hypothetical protein